MDQLIAANKRIEKLENALREAIQDWAGGWFSVYKAQLALEDSEAKTAGPSKGTAKLSKGGTMKGISLLLLISLITSSYPSMAQQRVTAVEIGGAVNASIDRPQGTGSFSFILQPKSTQRCRSKTTIDMRPVVGEISYAPKTGLECTVLKRGWLEVVADAQGGLATNPKDTSSIFNTGPSVILRPPFANGLGIVIGTETVRADAQGGVKQQMRFAARYEFGGK